MQPFTGSAVLRRRRPASAAPARIAATAALALAVAVLALTGGATPARAADDPGAVYTLTNEPAGNRVAIFNRAADGALTAAGFVATGGTGAGAGLGSQNALILSEDGRRLFAVNPGSNDISVFAVRPDGLSLVDRVPSGGTRPTSLTLHDHLLYVLNAGGSGNISGFTVGADGRLTPLAGSTRPLSTAASNPAQVQFTPDGGVLVVAERGVNVLSTYTVGRDGRATGPVAHPSAGIAPFGFDIDRRGHVIVSETFGGAPNGSAASSYTVGEDGSLSVVTASAATHQTAACWIVVTKNGGYAYSANAGSGSISGFAIGHDGSLSLLNATGRSGVTGNGTAPVDMATTGNGRYLYALGNGSHAIYGFRIEADGSLTPAGALGGVIAGAAGLAAR